MKFLTPALAALAACTAFSVQAADKQTPEQSELRAECAQSYSATSSISTPVAANEYQFVYASGKYKGEARPGKLLACTSQQFAAYLDNKADPAKVMTAYPTASRPPDHEEEGRGRQELILSNPHATKGALRSAFCFGWASPRYSGRAPGRTQAAPPGDVMASQTGKHRRPLKTDQACTLKAWQDWARGLSFLPRHHQRQQQQLLELGREVGDDGLGVWAEHGRR